MFTTKRQNKWIGLLLILVLLLGTVGCSRVEPGEETGGSTEETVETEETVDTQDTESNETQPAVPEEWHIFEYDGVKYDLSVLCSDLQGVEEQGRISEYVVAKGYVNEEYALFALINTETKTIDHHFYGTIFTYHSDDIHTIVYAHYNTIRSFDGTLFVDLFLNPYEYIRKAAYSEDKTKVVVSIETSDSSFRTTTIELFPPETDPRITQYTVEIPLEEERDFVTVAAVYGKDTSYSGPSRQNVIYAGEDGIKYYVMGVGNEYWSSGNFKSLHTYRVTSKDGYIESVEEVETFTKDRILQNGKPYNKSLDGLYRYVGCPLDSGNYGGSRLNTYSIYLHGDGTMEAVIGFVDMGGTIVYEGSYHLDTETGTFTAKLAGRTANNGEITIMPEAEVTGKLMAYDGFIHFICESSGIYGLSADDALPMTFARNIDGYATPAPIQLDSMYDGVWEYLDTDNRGRNSYSLSINTQTSQIQLIHLADGTSYTGTYTVNPLTMVTTATFRYFDAYRYTSELTLKFTLGYSVGRDGTHLGLDVRSCDSSELQNLVGKMLAMQQVSSEPFHNTITDIADWESLPWASGRPEGRIPASNAYNFIYNLVSGQSEIPEYNGLGIRDYSVELLEDSSLGFVTLRFTFTVTGMSLPETLLPGTHTWILIDGMGLSVYPEFMTIDQENDSYSKQIYGLDRFEGNSAVEAVHTYLSWMPIYEVSPYGEWDPENYHLPYNYICAYYGEYLEISFSELQRLMFEKFGITVERPDENRILSRCKYNAETDTVYYADTRGYEAIHKILDIREEEGVTYVIVQLFADRHRLIPSHKVQFAIGEGEVFLGSEIIQKGNYEPNTLR